MENACSTMMRASFWSEQDFDLRKRSVAHQANR
jgi:hypothetical protein